MKFATKSYKEAAHAAHVAGLQGLAGVFAAELYRISRDLDDPLKRETVIVHVTALADSLEGVGEAPGLCELLYKESVIRQAISNSFKAMAEQVKIKVNGS